MPAHPIAAAQPLIETASNPTDEREPPLPLLLRMTLREWRDTAINMSQDPANGSDAGTETGDLNQTGIIAAALSKTNVALSHGLPKLFEGTGAVCVELPCK